MKLLEKYIDEKREQRAYIYYMLKRDVDNMKEIILRNKDYSDFFKNEYNQVKYKWFKED
jgi:hypothetical protein